MYTAVFFSPQILSWLHPVTHAAITRSSQPLVGLSTKKSREDEALIQAIREANSDPSKKLIIMDARPWVNAVFNVVRLAIHIPWDHT